MGKLHKYKTLRICIWLLILFNCPAILYAQSYFFCNYSVRDGLAQSKVYSIIQDKDGYLWLGTESGVSQFDGVEFENYTAENGIADNGVRTVFQDSYGTIWFGHNGGGISRFKDGKFEVINLKKLEIHNDITSIAEDSDRRLWFGTWESGALLIHNPESEASKITVSQYKGAEKLGDQIYKVIKGSDNNIYFLLSQSIIKVYNKKKNSFDDVLQKLPRFAEYIDFFMDKKGDFWIGTYYNGMYKYSKNGEISYYDDKNGMSYHTVRCFYEDNQGNIWAGTWGKGITCFTKDGVKIFSEQNGFPNNKIYCITQDNEGNIVIGTNENGVYLYKGEHLVSFGKNEGINNPQIWAILQNKNELYLGTNNGLAIVDILTKKTTVIKEDEQIRCLKEDKYKNLWIGTAQNGVWQYSQKNKQAFYQSQINSEFYQSSVPLTTALDIDKENNLWVGTIDGLICYNIDNNTIKTIRQSDGLGGNEISAIYVDKNNKVWIGVKSFGITLLENKIPKQVDLGIKITPNSICEDKTGNIWIGTDNQGVIVWNGKKIIQHLKTENGLLSNLIKSISIDKDNTIYIGTNRGMNKYTPQNGRILSYTEKNGFFGIEVNINSAFISSENVAWFGTVNGAFAYNQQIEKKNETEPEIHIKSIKINLKDYPVSSTYNLGYEENSIFINYSSICFTNPDAVQYSVKLEGADKDWRPPTKQTTVNFSALAPGIYTFKVKACNNMGIWSSKPIEIKIEIKPPFYKTWWFITITLGILGLLIYVYVRIRERNLLIEKRILEEKVKERTLEVTQKNEELAAKNKDITDSIRYAKRIQEALLPTDEQFKLIFPDYFIYYRPRDIVSGDFFWISCEANKVFIVTADCTGHGVPGAFMSMLGISFLSEIVNKQDILVASEILNQLRKYVITSLKQTGKEGENQDGMDISLLIIDRENKKIQLGAANNSIYLVRNKEMITFKADKMPIGIYYKGQNNSFTNYEMDIQEGDIYYMFSDGYPDQFGGEEGSKFLTKNLKKLLLQNHELPMEQQRTILDTSLQKWKGKNEQIDDILVMGIKI